MWNTSEFAEEERIRRELFEELQHGEHRFAGLEPRDGPAEILVPADLRPEEQLFAPGPGCPEVYRGEYAFVCHAAVEDELHVPGPLEFLKNQLVHPRTRVDEGGGDDCERASVFEVPRRPENAFGISSARASTPPDIVLPLLF